MGAYDTASGVQFQRMGNGDVAIYVGGVEHVVPAREWVRAVACVSARGSTSKSADTLDVYPEANHVHNRAANTTHATADPDPRE